MRLVEAVDAQGASGPPQMDRLSGKWRLVWTDAWDVLSLSVLPGLQVGEVFQNVTEKDGKGKGDEERRAEGDVSGKE